MNLALTEVIVFILGEEGPVKLFLVMDLPCGLDLSDFTTLRLLSLF